MWLSRQLILLTLLIAPFAIAKNKVAYFEPTLAELNGVIKTLQFPGSPNYENIKNGDRDETGPYLILDKPIDIKLTPKIQIGNDEFRHNVKLIQLIVHTNSDWKKIKQGNYVRIRGTLFNAQTGHHHTRVLLEVNNVKVISKNHIRNKLDITAEDMAFLKEQAGNEMP